MSISTTQAVKLAHAYHDVMNMVGNKCAFHLPVGVSPRKALNQYLAACDLCGVEMHNEHWLAHAEKVVEELSNRRKQARVRLTGGTMTSKSAGC